MSNKPQTTKEIVQIVMREIREKMNEKGARKMINENEAPAGYKARSLGLGCMDCVFCDAPIADCPACQGHERKDGQDVIFVKIEEEEEILPSHEMQELFNSTTSKNPYENTNKGARIG